MSSVISGLTRQELIWEQPKNMLIPHIKIRLGVMCRGYDADASVGIKILKSDGCLGRIEDDGYLRFANYYDVREFDALTDQGANQPLVSSKDAWKD